MKRSIQIKESMSADGLGVPTISVYLSLCDKKELTGSFCKSCHNVELQENDVGYKLDIEQAIKIIKDKIEKMRKIFGKCELALIGGEPLSKVNRKYSHELAKYFNSKDIKSIVYTWRTPKQIKKEKIDIRYYNRIVCGEYIEELNFGDEYVLGSINQVIIDNNFNEILKYKGDGSA
jgi:hypothetical protein